MEYVPLEAFFSADGIHKPNPEHPELLERLRSAEVVISYDIMTERESIMFGLELLREIASGHDAKQVELLRIGIDQETDELEKLAALIQVVKGRHDYESSEE